MTFRFVHQPATATDPTVVGGKAAALARLGAAGFDVPAWFVVPPAALTDAGPVDGAAQAIADALATLGDGPFAVRSSAAGEDGALDSHAGQFLSLLNVATENVPAAIARVRASGFRESVAGYRSARGLGGGIAPAVIVQRMVPARAAGVAFSADPVTGARDQVLVDAVAGLADRLVGGEVDGELWRVSRTTMAAKVERTTDQPALTAGEAAAVATLALKVEAAAGTPQDIEWAFEGDRLFLLQARPITTLAAAPIADEALLILDNSNIVESYPGVVGPLTFSFARHVYAHVYRVLSGLLGVPEAVVGAHAVTFDNLLARTHGRVYYNLLNWYRILALLPGFRLNRGYMETMMGVAEALPAELADTLAPPPARGLARVGEWLRILRVGWGLVRHAHRLPRTIRAFQARLDAALADDPARLDALPPTALAAEYRKLEAALLERWDAPLVNDLICMIAFGASRRLLEKWAGPEGIALHGDVLIGQSDIVSAEPARLVRQMGQLLRDDPGLLEACRRGDPSVVQGSSLLANALRAYLDRFGDRCTEELKLESTPLTDDPAPLLQAIAAASLIRHGRARPGHLAEEGAQAEGDARDKPGHDALGAPEARLRALFHNRPLRRVLARMLLGWSKRRVRDRENLRFERTRLFGRVRRVFRAIGRQFHALGLLADPDDVFLLTVDEVLGAIEGGQVSEDLRGIAALRKAEMTRFAAVPDPPERLHLRGAAVAAGHADATPSDTETGDSRSGLACCSGIARGPVRVVRDPKREVVQPGEILVARHTDPGWIAQFASAAAVVVERGSLLSHSAIVARELGIPCVVGVKGATDWLATGDRVAVDGGSGIVSRIDPVSEI